MVTSYPISRRTIVVVWALGAAAPSWGCSAASAGSASGGSYGSGTGTAIGAGPTPAYAGPNDPLPYVAPGLCAPLHSSDDREYPPVPGIDDRITTMSLHTSGSDGGAAFRDVKNSGAIEGGHLSGVGNPGGVMASDLRDRVSPDCIRAVWHVGGIVLSRMQAGLIPVVSSSQRDMMLITLSGPQNQSASTPSSHPDPAVSLLGRLIVEMKVGYW